METKILIKKERKRSFKSRHFTFIKWHILFTTVPFSIKNKLEFKVLFWIKIDYLTVPVHAVSFKNDFRLRFIITMFPSSFDLQKWPVKFA